MKIKDLTFDIDVERNCYSTEKLLLKKYKDEDCVVVYGRGNLGNIFIIKGKKEYFAFYCKNPALSDYFWGKTSFRRMKIDIAMDLLKNYKVVMKKDFIKLKKISMLERLK